MSYKIHISSDGNSGGQKQKQDGNEREKPKGKKLQRTPARRRKKWGGGDYKPKRMKLPLEAENERTEEARPEEAAKNENKRHGKSPRRWRTPGRTKDSDDIESGKLKSNDDLCTRAKPWTASESVTGAATEHREQKEALEYSCNFWVIATIKLALN